MYRCPLARKPEAVSKTPGGSPPPQSRLPEPNLRTLTQCGGRFPSACSSPPFASQGVAAYTTPARSCLPRHARTARHTLIGSHDQASTSKSRAAPASKTACRFPSELGSLTALNHSSGGLPTADLRPPWLPRSLSAGLTAADTHLQVCSVRHVWKSLRGL